MKSLKKRILFYLSILTLLGINSLAGGYIPAEVQMVITILLIIALSLSIIYFIIIFRRLKITQNGAASTKKQEIYDRIAKTFAEKFNQKKSK